MIQSLPIRALLTALLATAVCAVAAQTPPAESASAPGYPPAARGSQVDTYHGTAVADPYRWLEDLDSPATRAWVQAQAQLSGNYLAAIPGRDRIAQRLKALWNFERWDAPLKRGGQWFYTHNDGLQNQPVLYTTARPDLPGRVLLDPNELSKDGTVAFKRAGYSDDGRLMAYGLSEAGSDWEVWRVRDVATGKDLPDELHRAKFGDAVWRKDGAGFFYSGYTLGDKAESLKAPSEYHRLFYHELGTPQLQDQLVYARTDDPDWFVQGEVSDDGKYLIVTAHHGTDVKNTLLLAELAHTAPAVKPVIAEALASYKYIGIMGRTLYVQTDDDAPRYRVVAIDMARPERASWRTVIAQSADTLDSTTLVGGQLIAQYLHDAHSVVRRYATDGHLLGEVKLPGIGSTFGFSGRSQDRETYYGFTSYTTPPSIYRLDLKSGRSTLWHAPKLADFQAQRYETRQVFFPSKDGTRVPMFIVARKDVALNDENPTILYGYGGFNISLRPEFSPATAAWIEMGGVYAVATLRGGGEYGRAWHEAGMKINKQSVFDDFAAAAQYLIANRWTSRKRLAISGGSNGGLLVAAVEEQHPDLFAAVIARVGVLDMMRFREFTVGKAWEADYGSIDNSEEFKAMLAYSPYHNVHPGVDYPTTLILTGDHDDRVFPAHSFKFAAALQDADPHGKPILVRIDLRAGHGAGKPLAKRIDEVADVDAFVLKAMGLAQ